MQLPEIVLALRAVEEGELQRDDLARLFTIMESWDRADLKASCGELLHASCSQLLRAFCCELLHASCKTYCILPILHVVT